MFYAHTPTAGINMFVWWSVVTLRLFANKGHCRWQLDLIPSIQHTVTLKTSQLYILSLHYRIMQQFCFSLSPPIISLGDVAVKRLFGGSAIGTVAMKGEGPVLLLRD